MEVKCSNCRRNLGKELLSCPRRNIGEKGTCQFQVDQHRLPRKGWAGLVFIGLGIALLPIIAYFFREGLPLWVKGVLTPMLIFGGGAMLTGVFQLLGTETILYNPHTGQCWQQITLFGIPFSESVSGAIEPIPWQGAQARVMRYPASVTALYRQDSATDIFSTTMLYLIAQEVIQLGQITVTSRVRRRKSVYVLRPGERYLDTDVTGNLEQRIWEIVGQANSYNKAFSFRGKSYPRLYPSALSLEDVVLMTFEGGQQNPGNFLVTEIVGKEAEALSLGEIRGERIKKLNPGKNTRGKIALDIHSIEQLYRDFWVSDPNHASEILARVDLFILTDVPMKWAQD